jgi:transposase
MYHDVLTLWVSHRPSTLPSSSARGAVGRVPAMVSDRMMNRCRVRTLWEKGEKAAEIQRDTGLQYKFVLRWVHRFEAGGPLEDLPRSGAPVTLTKGVKGRIARMMRGKKKKSVRVVSAALARHGITASREAVRLAAREQNLAPRHAVRKPLQPRGNRLKRRKFAKLMRDVDWTICWFGDEKIFQCYAKGNSKNDVIWYDLDATPVPEPTVKHGAKVNAYAAFSATGKTAIHLFTENMTAPIYRDILRDVLLPATAGLPRWVYLQDSSSTHTARATQAWLGLHVPEFIAPSVWPANSPDLNPIENAWAVVGARVAARQPTNLRTLKAAVTQAWEEAMTDAFRLALVESMPRRLTAVHAANGGPTRY